MLGVGLRFYQPSTPDQQPSPPENAGDTDAASSTENAETKLPFEASPEQIAWRKQALDALETLMARLQPLEQKGLQTWAPEEYQRLVETVSVGEQHYGEQRFREARDEYNYALLQVGALERTADPTFNRYMAQAEQLIGEKRYDNALADLEIARLIEPENETVPALINTATSGEAVDRLITKASFSLDQKQPSNALSLLTEALSLDPTREDVSRLTEEAKTLKQQMAFQDNMQAGFSALENQSFSDAISLFKQAQILEPGNADAVNALKLAEKQKLADDLNRLERSASAAMADEDWTQAIEHYQAALNLQPDTDFAETGLERATFFNTKRNQFAELLDKPERLADSDVADFALSVLKEIEGAQMPTMLAQASARLEEALYAYSTPVQVTVLSDNRSTITLLRRESFSPFREKTLALKPGQYTLVARRSGYRDKRITFSVPVLGSAISITIGVDEKL